jgi:hypothetical protein
MRHLLLCCSAALLLALPGCYGDLFGPAEEEQDTVRPLDASLEALPAADLFQLAADDHRVPRDLLIALAWNESSFAPGDDDHTEHRPAHGWMGLTPERVAWAAELTGYPEAAIESQRPANIFAGAAILSALRDELNPFASATEPDEGWWEIVVAWSEFGQEWLDHDFAREVFGTLQHGVGAPTLNGDILSLEPREIPGLATVRYVAPPSSDGGDHSGGIGYPGRARFTPAHSSNQSYRSNGTNSINRVVIHTTEGSYNGAISWFQNPSSNVSAHYVLRKSDGEVTQMVADDRKAWHACSNNNDTIGIEHEGASSNPATWTSAMFDSSARLTAWLVTEYDIPIDRNHIVGHGEIQPASCSFRSDPGAHFDWDAYLQKVAYYAGASSAAPEAPADDPGDVDAPDLLDGVLPTAPASPVASIAFQSPRNGDTVANPVIMRIASAGVAKTEVWAGPYLIAQDLTANPVHVGVLFHTVGERTLKAKGYSTSGAVVATDTITVDVRNIAGKLSPTASHVEGMTWTMNAAVTAGAAPYQVRYWVDGWAISDVGHGSAVAMGDGYPMHYTFAQSGTGRLLQARGYDPDGKLISEGFNYIDVPLDAGPEGGSILSVVDQAVTGTVVRLSTNATDDVAWVEYVVDGLKLPDMRDGATRAFPEHYDLWYEFSAWGRRNLEVRGYSESGALIDSWEQDLWVPAPHLSLNWSRVSPMVYRFDADAPAGTERVVIDIDGYVLTDEPTGHQYATGPEFKLLYYFNYANTRPIRARAYDQLGNVLETWTGTITNY